MISVIIPTYNRVKLLNQALISLTLQRFSDFEVIVIDDGSTQNYNTVIKKYQDVLSLKYKKINHSDVSVARNIGVANSRGDILAFFDDDATADKNWLTEIDKAMKKYDIIVGRGMPQTDNMWQYFAPHYDRGEDVIKIDEIWECNFAIFKKAFNQAGGFDEKIGWGHEGNELAKRLIDNGYKIYYYKTAVIYHNYAFNIFNYLKKQYKFGKKQAYIEAKYGKSNKVNQTKNAKLESLPIKNKITIKLIAKFGYFFNKIGNFSFTISHKL